MNRHDFRQLTQSRLLILDGATGTELAKRGLPAGCCPEAWILEHPDAILDLQNRYADAGSDIVYAPTFGANRHKLANFGLESQVADMNRRLVQLSRQAVRGRTLVFADIAPTGLMVEPVAGGAPFEDIVDIYKEQIGAILEAGADGFAIETMLDIQEARAALIAVRELAPDLPALVTLTFEPDGRTLTGTTPEAAVVTLQALGADAIGCNCSSGPADMARIIAAMHPYANVPLIAKPNAGLPHIVDGKTLFDMDAPAFAAHVQTLAQAGAALIGGCCGTTPDHIRLAAQAAAACPPPRRAASVPSCLSSSRQILPVAQDQPFAIIGERINPTGKKALQAELRQNDFTLLRAFAREQQQAGAAILDVNLGLPGGDEKALMRQAVALLAQDSPLPLCIDTTHPDVAEAALRLYPGRALFNSISAETDRIRNVLPIAAKYGAMIIILPLDDHGIPDSCEKRAQLVQEIFAEAQTYGYTKADVAVDGLVMTVSANPEAANVTLDLIEWVARTWKTNTVCGLSNVSFGLPRRDLINRAFLGLALGRGLNMAIANPMLADITDTARAADVLAGRDPLAATFIATYANTTAPKNAAAATTATTTATAAAAPDAPSPIAAAVLNGDDSAITRLVQDALTAGTAPGAIVNDTLIPAITLVGDRYEKKQLFLPQLLAAAKAMKTAMQVLLPLLAQDAAATPRLGRVIIATVEGDIHDIGKNIVAMLLNNYGFDVIDLGKDVPAATILDAAVRENVSIIGLSALMTTTMVRMRDVIDLARQRGLDHLRFIVGGAVVDQTYADSIGAIYAKDAMDTVRAAQRLAAELKP
ncbi:MAG: homocysteine S-methyltransferase family protein [Oligosphaeraceae bacterium]